MTPNSVFHLGYVDARTTPGEWEFSDGMTIGYFSSEERAREAILQLREQPGFRDDLGGFRIAAIELGLTRFPRGFNPDDDISVVDKWLGE